MSEGWDNLPYGTLLRAPITASLPNFLRWKINAVKLMLNDLKYLYDKHNIPVAIDLYLTIQEEANELCRQTDEEIRDVREKRAKYAKEEKTI